MVGVLRGDAPQRGEHRACDAGAADHLNPEVVPRCVGAEDYLDAGKRIRDPGNIRRAAAVPWDTVLTERLRVGVAEPPRAAGIEALVEWPGHRRIDRRAGAGGLCRALP